MHGSDGSFCAGLVGDVGAVDDAALAVRRRAHAVAPGELLPRIVGARDVRSFHAQVTAFVLADRRPQYQKS